MSLCRRVDIAHAKLIKRIQDGEGLQDYAKNHVSTPATKEVVLLILRILIIGFMYPNYDYQLYHISFR